MGNIALSQIFLVSCKSLFILWKYIKYWKSWKYFFFQFCVATKLTLIVDWHCINIFGSTYIWCDFYWAANYFLKQIFSFSTMCNIRREGEDWKKKLVSRPINCIGTCPVPSTPSTPYISHLFFPNRQTWPEILSFKKSSIIFNSWKQTILFTVKALD